MDRCLHGLDKRFCAECSGVAQSIRHKEYRQKQWQYISSKIKKEYYFALKNGQLDMVGESYKDKEIDSILTTEYSMNNLYELALEHSRTKKGIKFIYIIAFGRNVIPRTDAYYKQIIKRKAALNIKDEYLDIFNHYKLAQPKKKETRDEIL